MLRIALLLGLVAIVSAQESDICGYNSTLHTNGPPTYCGLKSITDFPFEQKRAGPPICIVLGYCNRSLEAPITEQWFRPAWKIVFWPDVDRYTLLEIDGSFELLRNVSYQGVNNTRYYVKDDVPLMNRTDLAISIEIGKIASSARLFYSERCTEYTCFVVPFFTAMIEIDTNVPKQVLWDDAGCYTCSGDACIGDFCGVDLNSGCKGTWTRGSLDCDVKVYLGWLGQDYRGNYLTSAGQRLSAFRTFSLATAYETAADTAAAARPQFPEEIPNIDFEDRGTQATPITVHLDDMHAGVAMLQPHHERVSAPNLAYSEPTYYLESNDDPHQTQ